VSRISRGLTIRDIRTIYQHFFRGLGDGLGIGNFWSGNYAALRHYAGSRHVLRNIFFNIPRVTAIGGNGTRPEKETTSEISAFTNPILPGIMQVYDMDNNRNYSN